MVTHNGSTLVKASSPTLHSFLIKTRTSLRHTCNIHTYMYSHRRISDDRLIIDMHATYTLTCTAIEGLVMTD